MKRIKCELTTKSSQKDDLNDNAPITLLHSFYFFQCELGHSVIIIYIGSYVHIEFIIKLNKNISYKIILIFDIYFSITHFIINNIH